MGSFERYKAYQAWIEDIELRLAEHLFFDKGVRRPDNWEEADPKLITAGIIAAGVPLASIPVVTTKVGKSIRRVEVLEDPVKSGVWTVVVNGIEVGTYVGPLAHVKATRLAAKYVNGD